MKKVININYFKIEKQDDELCCAAGAILENMQQIGPCLAPEEIAALDGGSLSEEESNRLWEHLASCDKCDQIYRMAVKLTYEDSEETDHFEQVYDDRPNVTTKHSRWRTLQSWGGFAAAAVVVLAVSLVLQNQKSPQSVIPKPKNQIEAAVQTVTPNVTAPGTILAPTASITGAGTTLFQESVTHQLAKEGGGGLIPDDPQIVSGFAVKNEIESLSTAQSVILIGKRLMRLSIAMELANRDQVKKQTQKLRDISMAQPLDLFLDQLESVNNTGKPLQPMVHELATTVSEIKIDSEGYISLGIWAESMRMAAEAKSFTYFQDPSLAIEIKRLCKIGLPQNSITIMDRIARTTKQKPLADTDFKRITRLVDELIDSI